MATPANTTPETPTKNIPAIEVDGTTCHLLDQRIPLGGAYNRLQELRKIREREYTLDVHTLTVLRALARGVNMKAPTLLEGPTAASKTSAIEYLALLTGHQYHRINLKGQTDTSEFLGKFVPNPNAKEGDAPLMWQDGLLVKAMKEGHWVILDELNLAEPQILEALNSVLEKYPAVTLTDNGGVKIGPGGDYAVHSNFRIFATMNPGYTGRQPLSPAFQNRWTNRVFVGTPMKDQLEAMLIHHTFGEQPKVTFQGEIYHGEKSEIPSHMEKVRKLAELTMKTLYSRLAEFHEAISQMAEKQEIGRSLDPGHVFTRRDLATFLDYIATAESFSRHTKETRNIETHPGEIIWEALRMVYLDKMNDQDDRKKVEKLLEKSKLDEQALKELFVIKAIITDTAGKAGAASKPDEASTEVKEIQEDLEKDYQRTIETLRFYDQLPDPDNAGELISSPLLQEDSDKPGTYFYEADYDGTGEADGKGEDFRGKKFIMPTFAEVLSWLTSDQVKLYKEMKEQGLEPRLRLTPIAMTIRSMGKRIDAKKAELEINTDDTFVLGTIKDHELIYEAEEFMAIDDGKKLGITGGQSKSQWVKEQNGWVVDIVATKEELTADEDKKTKEIKKGKKTKTVEYTNAEKTEKYMEDAKNRGYSGLGYETYLTAQMDALREKKPLDGKTWTILPASSLKDQDTIAVGYWFDDYVLLSGDGAEYQDDVFRFRRSVRVKKLEI